MNHANFSSIIDIGLIQCYLFLKLYLIINIILFIKKQNKINHLVNMIVK